MLNKVFRVVWLKIQIENTHIHFTLPISLYVFHELLDCTSDFLTLVCLFASNKKHQSSSHFVSVYTVKELVQMTMSLLDSLLGSEPYDLVDVAVDKVKISIKIK